MFRENKQAAAAEKEQSASMKAFAQNVCFTTGTAVPVAAALARGQYTVALRDEQSVTHLPLTIVK